MSKAVFTINFDDFDKKFMKFALQEAPKAAEMGLFRAAGELKRDADTVEPKTLQRSVH